MSITWDNIVLAKGKFIKKVNFILEFSQEAKYAR
jgi:hypothetical protein